MLEGLILCTFQVNRILLKQDITKTWSKLLNMFYRNGVQSDGKSCHPIAFELDKVSLRQAAVQFMVLQLP